MLLPLRKLPKAQKFYEVQHGRATLAIVAGGLLDPRTRRIVHMDVPSGSAARIALAHINNHLIRSKGLDDAFTVPVGESLRDFMGYQGISICGHNGKDHASDLQPCSRAHHARGMERGACAADRNEDRRHDRFLAGERPAQCQGRQEILGLIDQLRPQPAPT
ncbi:MAG: hypothetical protein ACXWG4_11140 [Thermoanaerobaculia bacterium]